MPRILITLLAAAVLTLAVTATATAGGGGHTGVCRAFAEGATLTMRDSCFEGIAHTVEAGTAITVVNDGELPHTATAVDGSFDTGTIRPGESTTLTLDAAGFQRIYCTLHGTTDGDGMAGVIDVVAAEPDLEPAAAGSIGTPGGGWLATTAIVAAAAYLAGRRLARRSVDA